MNLAAREFSQTLPRFSPGYESTENMFYFFYKYIIFRLKKEKDDMRSALCVVSPFNLFHETVNSHNLETANHIAHVIFVHHSAMKTHLLTNQNARTIQIILYVIIWAGMVGAVGRSLPSIHLTLQKPEISAGSMGHLARKGFSLASLFFLAKY